jgi:hypothetical protein
LAALGGRAKRRPRRRSCTWRRIAYINPVKSFEATAADATKIFDIQVS